MNQLSKALLTNAIFSGVSGIVLFVGRELFAPVFALASSAAFGWIGIALLFFAGTILYEIRQRRPIAVLWIIIQDFLWVVGSLVLLVGQPFGVSTTGNIIIGVVAAVVLLMAVNQARALAKIDRATTGEGKQIAFERIVKAPKEHVWAIISDVKNYDQVAPNIDKVTIVSGEEEGMVRRCSHGKNSWTETCTLWVPEQEYSFEVNTNAPDYPFPILFLKGRWNVQAVDEAQTKITMSFNLAYQRKFYNWLVHPLLKRKFEKTAEGLLDNWQHQIENTKEVREKTFLE